MTNKLKRPEVIRVYEKDLDDKGHGIYTGLEYWYKGKPFTGFVVDDYHKNGNIAAEQEYVNGQTMGWRVMYYENGDIEDETLYYGATTVYFKIYEKNGKIKYEGWNTDKEYYNRVAEKTGMPPIKLEK